MFPVPGDEQSAFSMQRGFPPGSRKAEIEQSFLSVGSLKIHLLQSGSHHDSTQVLFLHGGSSDSAGLSWKRTLPVIGSMARVVAPDLPGFGLSEKPDIGYSLDFYTRFVEDLIRRTDLIEPVVVGSSMGGWIALELVLDRRIHVRGLVLVDSAGYRPAIPFSWLARSLLPFPRLYFCLRSWISRHPFLIAQFLRFIIGPGALKQDPELLRDVAEEMRRDHAGRAWRSFLEQELEKSRFRNSCGSRLHELEMPVQLIHGRKDRLVPVEWAEEAHRKIPDSRLQVFEDCGHWPSRECPERFNSVLKEFLEELSSQLW